MAEFKCEAASVRACRAHSTVLCSNLFAAKLKVLAELFCVSNLSAAKPKA